jgi:hypothetical protein
VEQRPHRESGGPEPAGCATHHFPRVGEEYAEPLEPGRSWADAERAQNVPGDGPGAVPGMPAQVSGRRGKGERRGRDAGIDVETAGGCWESAEELEYEQQPGVGGCCDGHEHGPKQDSSPSSGAERSVREIVGLPVLSSVRCKIVKSERRVEIGLELLCISCLLLLSEG